MIYVYLFLGKKRNHLQLENILWLWFLKLWFFFRFDCVCVLGFFFIFIWGYICFFLHLLLNGFLISLLLYSIGNMYVCTKQYKILISIKKKDNFFFIFIINFNEIKKNSRFIFSFCIFFSGHRRLLHIWYHKLKDKFYSFFSDLKLEIFSLKH